MLKKRKLIALLLTLVLLVCSGISSSAAGTESVKVTETIIVEMAERFADALNPKLNLEAINPIKFYDQSGQAIGYIVDYYRNNMPAGYVVFDNTRESLISEYSFDVGAKNPYQKLIESMDDSKDMMAHEDDFLLCKSSPFTYELIDNECALPASDVNPSTWNDVFLSIQEIYEDYNLVSTNNISEFLAISEEYIEEETGHYGCALSALYACAMYYDAANYFNLTDDYLDLWDMTDTTLNKVKNGIRYGSTATSKLGPGFVAYCASRDVSVSQVTNTSPSYAFFTNTIDRGDMAVFCAGIMKEEDGELVRSGHAMAVEGYATIRGINSGNTVKTLMVFDGWYEQVAYLNYDFADWTDTAGVSFNG